MPADEPDLRRVAEIYEGWTAAEEGEKVHGVRLLLSDLINLLTAGKPLTLDQQRLLFRDRRHRDDFTRLRNAFAARLPDADGEVPAAATPGATIRVFAMPALAAAATDEAILERVFVGGRTRIIPSRSEGQVYINITLDSADDPPDRLQLQRLNHEDEMLELAVVRLGEPDDNRLIRLIRRSDDPFVRLLRAPDSEGVFLDRKTSAGSEQLP